MNQSDSSKKILNGTAIVAIALMVAATVLVGTSLTSIMAASTNSTNETSSSSPQAGKAIEMPKVQGSIDLREMLKSSIKTGFSDAANAAASSVSGGMVLSGGLGVNQGYYVYNFLVMDSEKKVHHVIVDAGNGKVLHTSEGFDAGIDALGMHDGMFFGFPTPPMSIGANKVFIQSAP